MTRKKWIAVTLACITLCLPMQASSFYKTKKVLYTTPYIYYNGSSKNMGTSAIIIDGTTYAPVRGLCNALGFSLGSYGDYMSITNNSYSSSYSSQAEVQAKDNEIASLKKELSNLRNQLGIVTDSSGTVISNYTRTDGTDILGTELTATRKDLEGKYSDYFNDINFDFSVSLSSGKVKVTITYDSSDENKAYNKLSSTSIKKFMKDVCGTVRDHHDNVIISGAIKYNNSTKDTFSYSKKDSFSYNESSSSYDYEDDIEYWVKKVLSDASSVSIDDYSSSLAIKKTDVTVSNARERVVFDIYLSVSDSESALSAWNSNTGTDNNLDLRSSLKSLSKKIANETDYEIFGTIYDSATGKEIGNYDYEYNEIRTSKLS